ncbi:amino acid adenylation domain-containing protein [Chlorobium sp. BLA1]|uniref:non-ribosomal peptide synthetase n=1 Tax=Candidatus Chlorobium masyuteum TaxID=2716876 RepID=UPI0014243B2D|nr:non-ribosomal peptide synthetase [Candidatus Chlorobium masyuteum]NHQ60381.1 amino acid adenylation domain-containing protein [Candidatus Chlorobium masyuteum]
MTTPSHDFWRTFIADLPPLPFYRESSAPSPGPSTKEPLLIEEQLDALRTGQLKAFAEACGISFSTLLLAVHARVLSLRMPGQRLVTGITINSRHGEVTLPFVFDGAGSSESWSEYARRIGQLEASILRRSESFPSEPDESALRPLFYDTRFQFIPSTCEKTEANPQRVLESRIHELWQKLLPGAEFSVDDGFFDAGGNSLLLVRLHEKLAAEWPGVFSVAKLFSVVTVAAQARFIMENTGQEQPEKSAQKEENARQSSNKIAIVGIGVRLPGAGSAEGCWKDVSRGADRVSSISPDRLQDTRDMFNTLGSPLPGNFREAAWLEDIYDFDPERFRFSPADAALVHPEQRLFFETALMALENAGYGGRALDNEKIGVFAAAGGGSTWTEYALKALPERAEQIFINNVPSNIATRLSFLHNWRGPATVVDTACSSSLTAVHLACNSLLNGECSAALAGGAKLIMMPPSSATRFTIESSTARTHAFDESADGTGAGEGSVIFFLKTLEQAELDRDPVHAVILGTAINQDGASSGMAAPNPEAQSEVIAAAAAKAGVPLSTISYIEAHGTGTHLGDPVEIEGIRLAFSRETSKTGFALIGSAKGNYGHLDACAGALGLLRAVLCLKNDQAPPQPFFTRANPRIDFDDSPVRVSTSLCALPDLGTPRRAGVSSFGLSGINVHAIIEAPPPANGNPELLSAGWMVIGLSAATAPLLKSYADALAVEIRLNRHYRPLDIAYTLNSGRDSLAERLAIWFRDRDELLAALEGLPSAGSSERSLSGRIGRRDRSQQALQVTALCGDEDSARVAAEAFLEGAQLVLSPQLPLRRLHLAGAPLQRISCRPPRNAGQNKQHSGNHPFFLRPTDTPEGKRYPLDLHSAAFWPVAEHLLAGVPTLVGMGILPLLAFTRSEGSRSEGEFSPFAIRELSWLRPLQPSLLQPGSVSMLITGGDEGVHRATLGGRMVEGGWRNFAEAALSDLSTVPTESVFDKEQTRAQEVDLKDEPDQADEPAGPVRVSARWNALRARGSRGDEFFARLQLPAHTEGELNMQGLHPGVLDRAVSIAIDRPGLVPAGCAEILVYRPLPESVFASAERVILPDGGIKADVRLYDSESGELSIRFRELHFVPLSNPATELKGIMKVPVIPSLPVWVPDPVNAAVTAILPIALVGEGDLFRRITAHSMFRGALAASCSSVEPDDELLSLLSEGRIRHLLFVPEPGEDIGLRTLNLLQKLMAHLRHPLHLVAAGEGAFAPDSKHDSPHPRPDTALMAGLVMVAGYEEPMLLTRYVEVDKGAPLELLFREFEAFEPGEHSPILLDNSGRRLKRCFEPLGEDYAAAETLLWPASGCCVVSGGTGGLALLLAAEFAGKGAVSLALLSRRELEAGEEHETMQRFELLEALAARGITVRHWKVDVSNCEELSRVLDEVRSTLGPISAVVHFAGLVDSHLLVNETPESFARATAPKVEGARNLDLLTRHDPIESFVLSGSLTALESRAGSGAYTAANLYLDAFARWRRSEGRPALTIDWCQVGEVGMAARLLDGKLGEYSLSPDEVIRYWRMALGAGTPQVSLLYGKTPGEKAKEPPVLPEEPKMLEKALAQIWAEILGYESVDSDDDFYSLGGDSMSGIDIVDRIVKELGHPLSYTDLVESATVGRLAEKLRSQAEAATAGEEGMQSSQRLTPAPAENRYPVSREQLALIQAQLAAERSIAYNLPNIISLPSDCDRERLESALRALISRHEILRTRFCFDGSEPEMEIVPEVALQLNCIRPREEVTPRFWQSRVRPFDLESEPPVRFELIESAEGNPQSLFMDIHHALADGLSLELLTGDLAQLYAGKTLPSPSLHFKDYAWWSRRGAGVEAFESAKEYWLQRYHTLPLPVLDLPSDRPRPAYHTWECGSVAFTLPQKSVEALRRFASTHATTPFTVVLSAWAALLARYSCSDDLVISVPVDARERVGASSIPGMMVSLIPLRIAFIEDESVEGFISRLHSEVSEAMRNRACPLGMLLEAIAPPPAPERTLLSEVTLSYMNFSESKGYESEGEGRDAFRLFGVERSDGKNDLSIFIRDLPAEISVTCEYYSAIFDRDRIERMGEHFTTLLDALVISEDETKLATLPLIAEWEREWLLKVGRGSNTPQPEPLNLYACFAAMAKKRGSAIAISDKTERLSYTELLCRAEGIAQYLALEGVREGEIVAMHLERSCTGVAIILAINALGACYLPLDTSFPALRIALILADAACRVVIADASGRKVIEEADHAGMEKRERNEDEQVPMERLIMEGEKLALMSSSSAALPERREDVLAYLMYTSGSTGQPKGVRVLERGIIRLTVNQDYIEIGHDDRVMLVSSLAFDISTFDLWGALLNGAELCVIDRNVLLDPAAFAAEIACRNITIMAMATGLFHRQAETMPESFSTVHKVLAGGELMNPELLKRAAEAAPQTGFYNVYGPTENTTFTTTHLVTPGDLNGQAIPIGKPIPLTTVMVYDKRDQVVPIGIWGEIINGGEGVADGYQNRPELTAAGFFKTPEGEYCYRTGDIGRWRVDGVLEIGGRRDTQIKHRGFRIELGEIEDALCRHPLVAGAAVLFRKDAGELLACLVIRGDEVPEPIELRSWLMQRIPSYMVPARFIRVARMPINSNGKLDRKRLDLEAEDGELLRDGSSASSGLPTGDTEKMVAEVFSEIFNRPVEERNISFLVLGGHSLIIMRAINRIAQRSGVKLSISDFFATPTIAGLASRIDAEKGRDDAGCSIPVADSAAFPFASHAEERLYMVNSMDATSAAYNMTFFFRTGGEFVPEALHKAIVELVRRHEALRTGFEECDGMIMRRIAEPHEITLEWREDDLSSASDPSSEALLLTRVEVARPFDLSRPPLLRIRIIRLGREQTLILIMTHHIVHDGWSSRIFLRELKIAYEAALHGTIAAFPELPVSIRDYAVWQRTRDWSESAAWWLNILKGAPERIELPCDRPLPEIPANRGATIKKELPPEIARALQLFARQSGVSMASVGLTLFATLLYRLTRQSELVIGMGVAGRDHAELEGLIGFFVNVLPIRIRLDRESEFSTLLGEVHDMLMGALAHREYPFDSLVRDLAPKRSGNRQPLINVVFEYQRFDPVDPELLFPAAAEISDSFARSLDEVIFTRTAKHDLLLFYVEQEERTVLLVEYDTDILDSGTVERWISYFIQLSGHLCAESLKTTESGRAEP